MRRIAVIAAAAALIAAAAAPPITLTPSAGMQGETLDITTNAALSTNGTVAFEPAGNISVSNLRAPNKVLVFTIKIAPAATTGAYAFVYTPIATASAAKPLRVANAFTVQAAPQPQPQPQPTPQPTPQPAPVPQPQPTPQPAPVPQPQPAPVPQPVPQPQPKPKPKPQPQPTPVPQPAAQLQPAAPQPQPTPQPPPESTAGAGPVTQPQPVPAPQPEPVPQPAPVPQPPPPPKPPVDSVIGPRIDIVTPQTLQAGLRYTLKLQGKNLSPDTAISFGRNIMIIGVPIFTTPTDASVDVLVSLAAPPGVATATAKNASGSNRGPGGVLITTAPTAPIIVLDDPHDDIVAAEQTMLSWHESQPGTAAFFLFELTDEDGNVMFSAQTTKSAFTFSPADIDLIASRIPRRARWSVRGIGSKMEVVEGSEERPLSIPARP